ncbi:ABC transporter ATP-binding protein [Pseudokineococcus marinus]|uniref:ABC transporter ATP-binding protein n=1 Tax=Pseudokineococcus marinus TaxID=351215 RepID=A0A849BRY2_9ACTN|nr:ABC transporter ATP-binding protein [Pseudokineococcus marinus]NNH24305.1 ABC transporter ATP-binding protein [Pseudokineococcus marinus]
MGGPPDGSPSGAALRVRGLVKRYGARTAVDGLDLDVAAGSVTALLGPNGAGKTSTVECCLGLRRPDGGSVEVLGADVLRAAADPDHRAAVGAMLQDGGLPTSARPLRLLRHLARLHAHPRDVDVLAERLGLPAFARTSVRRLSGGQRQRLALAAALVGRPRLLFLDEPTAGLDPAARLVVWDLVREAVAEGAGVLLTTHDLDEAERLAQHVVIVDGGRALATGAPGVLTARSTASLRFTAGPGLDLGPLRRALPEDVVVSEAAPGSYVVSGDVDPQVVAGVTSWCAQRGVMPDALSVGRPSLEEVFLDLTGRSLR